MTLAQIVDCVCLALAFAAPVIVVLRSHRWFVAIPLGGVIFWIVLYLCGRILSVLDPLRSTSVLDTIWLYVGLLPALLYTALLYGLRKWVPLTHRRC
ncbi:MAG: hypothetical protein U1F71_10175 [Verrucomicrobiaceae bacterium]